MAERPLEGRRIVVTRPREQAQPLAEELKRLGATVLVVPLIEIEPVDDLESLKASIRDLHRYDWFVVTSANTVTALGQWPGLRWLARNARVAAVGPATAASLRRLGIEPDFVPDRFAADEIVAGLGSLDGARVILTQSDSADARLAEELRDRGATVNAIVAYRTVALEPSPADALRLREADAVVLASGSAARSLASAGGVSESTLLVCIGPKTSAVAREVGLPVGLVADEATADGIIRALVSHFGESRQ